MFHHVFRLNPLFNFTRTEDLTEEQRARLKNVLKTGEFTGFLHAPRECRLSVKAVNQELAAFLQNLSEPRRLSDVFERFGEGTEKEKEDFVIQLVLDSVLEVKVGEEFISGVRAVDKALMPTTHPAYRTRRGGEKNFIQVLSDRSLRFAIDSAHTEPRDLSILLYNFNRIPVNRRWKRRIADEGKLLCYLDLEADGSWPGMPDWVKPRQVDADSNGESSLFDRYWRSWTLMGPRPAADMPTYKVYFSPHPQELPDVFRTVREAATHSDAHAMKTGRTLSAILRADKLIVYFPRYKQAAEFARKMARETASFKHQGIPFSCQIDPDNPLVSMGVDPPRSHGDSHSWRLYITNKAALAIQGARRDHADDPLGYIRRYMRMIGVDSENWRPLSDDWDLEFFIEDSGDEQFGQTIKT
jgi:hypothetical protein